MSRRTAKTSASFDRGFTLIEILIVVVILGILAAVVLPQFSNASQLARENTLKDELRYLRTQIGVFRAQHSDTSPGYPNGNTAVAPDEDSFIKHMTGHTDMTCAYSAVTSPDYPFGPYLSAMPANPVSGQRGVYVYAADRSMPEPDQAGRPTIGWIYNPLTQQIIPNLTGNDSNGVPYAEY